jgi:hypothetical protein
VRGWCDEYPVGVKRLLRGITVVVVALSLMVLAGMGWCAWRVDQERYDAVLFIGGERFVQWYPRRGPGWQASTGVVWITGVRHRGVVGPRWLDREVQFDWLNEYQEESRRPLPLGVWITRGTTRLPEDGMGNVMTGSETSGYVDLDVGSRLACRTLSLPLWMCFGLLGLPTVGVAGRELGRRWRRRARVAAGRCVACGYDLRGTPGRCPECGREVGAGKEG